MGTGGRETQDMGNTGLTLLPLPNGASRTVHHPTVRGGRALWRPQGTRRQDRTGGLQGGARSGTHGGAREAMAGRGTREAMAGRGTREAMAGPPPRPRPQPPPRSLRQEPYYPPKKKNSLGKIWATSGTWGRTGSADSWGRWRGAGSGVRWRGAGSGVRWQGAGTGREGATTGRLATGTAGRIAILTAGGPALAANGGVLGRAVGGWLALAAACLSQWRLTGLTGVGLTDWTAGWFWLGAGHSPDTGRSPLSNSVLWCLGGPQGDGNWPRARTDDSRSSSAVPTASLQNSLAYS